MRDLWQATAGSPRAERDEIVTVPDNPGGDHGKCCQIPLAAYVAGARRDLAAMGFTPGHETNIIHHLLLEIDRLNDPQVVIARFWELKEHQLDHLDSDNP